MTQSAHTAAMQARIEHDSLDSVSPFDFDPERGEQWRLPAGEPLSNKFDQPRRFGWADFWQAFWRGFYPLRWRAAARSYWQRLAGWLGGLAS